MNSNFRIIIRFILSILFSIGVVYMAPKLMRMNKEEIEPIIKIEEYGFVDIKIYDSLLGKAKFNNDIGGAYHLDFHCEDKSNSYLVDVMIYEWKDKTISKEFYKDQIEKVRQKYLKRTNGSAFSDTIVPKLPYDKAIEYMFPVDLDEWGVDEGYSTTDIHTEITSEASSVFIVLLKDNQVMSIEYTNNFLLDSDNIKVFDELFKESETLFQ